MDPTNLPAPPGAEPETGVAHWHAGWNRPGYLPESEPATLPTFEEARDALAAEMATHADNEASWADEHDCDDIPCPTYGDGCPHQRAGAVEVEREVLLATAGPEWSCVTDALAYWVTPCDEPGCLSEDD
jgi:hypothetical protein